MSLDRAVMAFAGVVVLFAALMSVFVHPSFVWLAAFAGANMLQSSITGFCPAAILLRKLGIKPGSAF